MVSSTVWENVGNNIAATGGTQNGQRGGRQSSGYDAGAGGTVSLFLGIFKMDPVPDLATVTRGNEHLNFVSTFAKTITNKKSVFTRNKDKSPCVKPNGDSYFPKQQNNRQ